jgi:glycosyltransferase involved in cell wall biosynthesis
MREAIARRFDQKRFDCAIVDGTTTLEYLLHASGIPKILFHHNVDSVVIKRDYETQNTRRRRIRRWMTWRKAAAYERRVSRQADAHAMVSPVDKEELLALAPDLGPVEVIGNGVDMDSFRVDGVKRNRDSIIFASLLKYAPNRDGLRQFCREIFPEIRKTWENAVLRVTGHFAGMGVDDLRVQGHVEFTGYLDDIRPAIASSWVSIAPIHVGSGTRLKILEAMALGTPVVSTTVGAEGLDVEHEREILIADTPSDFAKQILRLHDDERLWGKLSENGRRLVQEKYDWRVLGKKFDSFLCRVCDESPPSSADMRTPNGHEVEVL